MKNKFKKAAQWMAKNIATTVFCFVVIALGTAIVARATVTGTTIGNSISTEGLTANTATIGTLSGILKGTSGTVSAISNGSSGQYLKNDATWADLNQAAVAGLTTSSSPVFAGLTAGGATGVTIGDGTISDPTGTISFGSNDLTTSGTISSTGAAERVQGTDSFIDFNDPSNTYSLRLGGNDGATLKDYIDIDFDTGTDGTITFSGDGTNIWNLSNIGLSQTYTMPATTQAKAFSLDITQAETSGASPYAFYNKFTTNSTGIGGSILMYNFGVFADGINHGASDSMTAQNNEIDIKGVDNDVLSTLKGTFNQFFYRDATSDDDMTVTNIYGSQSDLRSAGADNLTNLDVDNYNAFYSSASNNGNGSTMTGDDWAGIRLANLVANVNGTVARQYGMIIEDLTGTAPYGIVLNDGADCIYMGGTSGPKWCSGSGSPENALSAPVGSMYSRTDGGAGTSLYVKESGAGNTGWVGK